MTYLASHARSESHPARPGPPPGPPRRRQPGNRRPVLVILAVQAALSLSLVARPIVQDEATYIDAGNAEFARWLHGAQTLPYPQFFSGAPVIYPPLSAATAGAGGLVATRLLSLCFLLAATVMLWLTARRLFGGQVPLYASALFATTAAVQYMGALATFDALALLLLAAAAWCAVRAAEQSGAARIGLLAALCVLLLLANATKYASALWDPVVVAVAGLCEARRQGWGAGVATGAVTALSTVLLLAIAGLAAGPSYWRGIQFSTLNRTANSGTPASVILESSARWVGLIALLAMIGAVLLTQLTPDIPMRALAWVLTAAVFLAPFNQARIGVIVSLFKHVGFGAWFAAIPAGYAVAVMVSAVAGRRQALPLRRFAAGLAVVVLAIVGVIAVAEAQGQTRIPALYSQSVAARLRPMLYQSRGPWLGDSPTVIIYYTHTPSVRWRNTFGFTYVDPHTGESLRGTAAYVAAVRHHYFGIIVLRSLRRGNPVDRAVVAALKKVRGYRLTVIGESGPQGTTKVLVWRLVGGNQLSRGPHRGQGALGAPSAAAT